MRLIVLALLGASTLAGCGIPLRYQDTEHYKSRLQSQSDRRMQEHLRVEGAYIARAKLLTEEVERIGAASVLANARTQIADSLKDPDSAKFRNVRFIQHEGGALICGEVNAKNAYGGYVGYTKFLSDSKESEIYDESSRDVRLTTKITFKCTAPTHQEFQTAASK